MSWPVDARFSGGLATGDVTVTVPATSANLGPGFDCLGLALDLRDTLVARVTGGRGVVVEVSGEGAGDVPRDGSHLVVRAIGTALAALDVEPPGLVLTCENVIPHARGLGSSSAAIVGGLVLGRALVEGGADRLPDAELLALANAMEGHPDNVAPALYGGFVIAGQADGEVWALPAPVDPRISAVVTVPTDGVLTEVARGLLPDTVDHAVAAANSGRAALLVAALAGDPELLWRGTEDFLHQAQRRPAMPASLDLVDALRGRGIPAIVSGAGPTVLAFVVDDDPAVRSAVTELAPTAWRTSALTITATGAVVVEPPA